MDERERWRSRAGGGACGRHSGWVLRVRGYGRKKSFDSSSPCSHGTGLLLPSPCWYCSEQPASSCLSPWKIPPTQTAEAGVTWSKGWLSDQLSLKAGMWVTKFLQTDSVPSVQDKTCRVLFFFFSFLHPRFLCLPFRSFAFSWQASAARSSCRVTSVVTPFRLGVPTRTEHRC